MVPSLGAARAALYPYTRPLFGLAGLGTALVADGALVQLPQASGRPQAPPEGSMTRYMELTTSGMLAAVGIVGSLAVLRRRAGLAWLSHPYERWAWAGAYGSLPLVAAAAAVDASQDGGDRAQALLAPAAGAVLATTAGERLGSNVGRACVPLLTGLGCVAAAMALGGDPRGESAAGSLQRATLMLLPALQVGCLPVYTLSAQGTVGLLWLGMAAYSATLPPSMEEGRASRHLFCAIGAASVLRTLCARRPICQF